MNANSASESGCLDRLETEQYVELLHRSADGVRGKLIVCCFHDDHPGVVTHHNVGDINSTVEAIAVHFEVPGANVYMPLSVMRHDLPRGKKGGEADVIAVLGLVADMDADTGKIGEMPIEPSYVVETSPGNSQRVILFDKPLSPVEAKPLAVALKKASGSDHGTADISHVWRIPGTLNWPTKTKLARGRSVEPFPVTIKEPFSGLIYDSATLNERLRSETHQSATKSDAVGLDGHIDTTVLWAGLTDIARAHLTSDGQPNRSDHLARIVEQLHFEKRSLDETRAICCERPGAWAEKYETDERMIKDIERIWRKYPAEKERQHARDAAAAEAFVAAQVASPAVRTAFLTPPAFDAKPFDLVRPGGLITDVAAFVHDTSPSPIPEFAIASAVALHAAMFGRRFLTPDGLGLNLYIANVAGSGFGKDRPLKALGQIADAIGMGHIVGPNDVASDSAIEVILRQYACQVLPIDEMGIFLSASGRGSDSYLRARRKTLLELYSSATSPWVAKVRASDAANGKDPKPKIIWPTLSILGATTPPTFYEGLEDDAFASGFMARLIVVAVDQPPKRQRINGYPEVPRQLVDRLLEAVSVDGGPFAGKIIVDPYKKPSYAVARWFDEEAALRLDQIRDWALQVALADERRGQIVNRAGDHTSKLATIRAISRDPRSPTVTVNDLEWAFGIVWRSIQTVEDGAERYMSGSPFEALCKAIVEAVRQCKDEDGLKNAELLRKPGVKQADTRTVDQALTRLISGTGQIVNVGKERLGPGGMGGRYKLATLH
ncbi:DNA-primase RepB domain-containing protein [Bradyrhizobium yuanmingense]|uniref:DNA-primase RepB domain-containing protein n=1 Tax=Bradyrhizobium yuanmingense TaxID=108015 RepID=UPI0023B945C0|nr:DNA-primase RepB domain-containing protein [Bradyrhizobium yuanmingense]MDF0521790.1 DNA-primase RepB domain-containing protein [Bradyrhizobium yuanmingense]